LSRNPSVSSPSGGATETETASSHVLSAAQLASGDSNHLKVEVAKFLESVRTA
jgi:methyl-accepting chemotaxis protein